MTKTKQNCTAIKLQKSVYSHACQPCWLIFKGCLNSIALGIYVPHYMTLSQCRYIAQIYHCTTINFLTLHAGETEMWFMCPGGLGISATCNCTILCWSLFTGLCCMMSSPILPFKGSACSIEGETNLAEWAFHSIRHVASPYFYSSPEQAKQTLVFRVFHTATVGQGEMRVFSWMQSATTTIDMTESYTLDLQTLLSITRKGKITKTNQMKCGFI